ncbi:hypothetical protein ACIRBZ_07925 [Streptomyces sp. NPDC094038]|uniref:hypothetical protein n=1 Tax=Streptomyces sp. NPDC094038 TaxID=3366055 RepID=UPI00382B39A6
MEPPLFHLAGIPGYPVVAEPAVTDAVPPVPPSPTRRPATPRGEWVTNEKRLLERAGLRGVDDILGGLRAESGELVQAAAAAELLFGFA